MMEKDIHTVFYIDFLNLTKSVSADPQVESESESSLPIMFIGSLSYITRLELVQDFRVIGTKKFVKRYTKTNFTLTSDSGVNMLGFQKFTINGYVRNIQVLQTFRYIRFIPYYTSYLQLNRFTQIEWNFEFNDSIVLYNRATNVENGWFKINSSLIIGNGITYANKIVSEVSIFAVILSEQQPFLFLQGNYETELNFDFLYVQVRCSGISNTLLNLSGTGVLDESIGLSNYVGRGKVEIVIGFKSDGAVTMRGVLLSVVSIGSDVVSIIV